MRGDEWNRLVGEPTAMDLDAALAEVRVRAIPIARRNARNHRAGVVLTGLLVLGGAFWAGRVHAGGNVRVGATEFNESGQWPGSPRLVATDDRPPVPVLPAAGPTLQRFRLTTWTEWDGERFAEGEAWIEGPPGLSFSMRSWFLDDSFDATFTVYHSADSSRFQAWTNATRLFGASPRGLPLTERGFKGLYLTVARGQPLLLYPFGRGGWGEPTTVVRIEGPDLPAPAGLHWSPPIQSWARDELGMRPVMTAARTAFLASAGVRFANPRPGNISVLPTLVTTPTVVRLRLADRADAVEIALAASAGRFDVPGISGKLTGWLSNVRGDSNEMCLGIRRATGRGAQADRDAGREPLQARACVDYARRFEPFTMTTNHGHRLTAQLVRLPGVNY